MHSTKIAIISLMVCYLALVVVACLLIARKPAADSMPIRSNVKPLVELEPNRSRSVSAARVNVQKKVDPVADTERIEAAKAEVAKAARVPDQEMSFDPYVDYDAAMIEAAINGDYEAGRATEKARNAKIDALGLEDEKIDFHDLFLLSKVIYLEAGGDAVDDIWRKKVGEVLVNRVASREFPNTFEECIHQDFPVIQYYRRTNNKWQRSLPNENSVRCAFALISGERILNDPKVVYQSAYVQGGGIADTLYSEIYGYTYLCYTDQPELYDDLPDESEDETYSADNS